jgi:hypothetical protein
MHQTHDYEELVLKKAVIPGGALAAARRARRPGTHGKIWGAVEWVPDRAEVPDDMTSSGASGMTLRVFWSTGCALACVVFLGHIIGDRSNAGW